MKKLVHFYIEEKQRLETELKATKNKLANLSVLRLVVFILTLVGIYFLFDDIRAVGFIATVGIIVFSILLIKYLDAKESKKLLITKIKINETEIRVLEGNFLFLKTGEEFIDPTHVYSNDIDLFGRGSFFQYINRTSTQQGAKELAKTITENHILSIDKKQEVLKELSQKVAWRQHFSALASLVTTRYSTEEILDFIQNYSTVFSIIVSKSPIVFSLVSIVLIALVSFAIIPFSILILWVFIGLGITALYFKKTQEIYVQADKAKATFKQYYLLLQEIENRKFSSAKLQEKQNEWQERRN